ncbi:MAG: hypothetical protein JWR86_2403 [Enterovirga sp.]|jgi:hypothetical protein|nr:hypothetical protein [Enterovirga sp.]
MRAVLRACMAAAGLVAALPAAAQGLAVPPANRAESQVNAINRAITADQQNRAAAQQNQFEVNALRNQLSRPPAPPLFPSYGVAPGLGR